MEKTKNFICLLKGFELREIDKAVDKLQNEKNLTIIDEIYDFKLISKLIIKFGLMTQDSILFSTAKSNKCNFFISRDDDFIKNFKLKDKYKKIKVISPEEAIREFFPEPKKSSQSLN